MSRKVWIHLRQLIRRSAWLLASFSSFVFTFAPDMTLYSNVVSIDELFLPFEGHHSSNRRLFNGPL